MAEAKAEIAAVLLAMAERYAAKDPDGVLALFVEDEPMVVGTGADEVRFGRDQVRAQIERDITQADSIGMEFGEVSVNVVGDAALCFANAAFAGSAGGEEFRLPVRMTAGLVRSGAEWRIAQFHVSVAFGDQQAGESFPV